MIRKLDIDCASVPFRYPDIYSNYRDLGCKRSEKVDPPRMEEGVSRCKHFHLPHNSNFAVNAHMLPERVELREKYGLLNVSVGNWLSAGM